MTGWNVSSNRFWLTSKKQKVFLKEGLKCHNDIIYIQSGISKEQICHYRKAVE